jgi:microcystin-dependent protein
VSTPFLAEIKIISWNFAPKGWSLCNGQLLPINQNQALFSLLGTAYGGNGQTTFALPDFRGRAALHQGGGFTLGQKGGEEAHTLSQAEMPTHNHFVSASNLADGSNVNDPENNYPANSGVPPYRTTTNTTFAPQAVGNFGGSQPHENRQPFMVVNFIIALIGIFPSQN